MSNLRSDCRELAKQQPMGVVRTHLLGLCLQVDQVEEFWHEAVRDKIALQTAIRKHRDQKGDDRCWLDDEELYRTLPEGYEPGVRDSAVELKHCERFIACRHNPKTVYVSPQRRIDELEAKVTSLQMVLDAYKAHHAEFHPDCNIDGPQNPPRSTKPTEFA